MGMPLKVFEVLKKGVTMKKREIYKKFLDKSPNWEVVRWEELE